MKVEMAFLEQLDKLIVGQVGTFKDPPDVSFDAVLQETLEANNREMPPGIEELLLTKRSIAEENRMDIALQLQQLANHFESEGLHSLSEGLHSLIEKLVSTAADPGSVEQKSDLLKVANELFNKENPEIFREGFKNSDLKAALNKEGLIGGENRAGPKNSDTSKSKPAFVQEILEGEPGKRSAQDTGNLKEFIKSGGGEKANESSSKGLEASSERKTWFAAETDRSPLDSRVPEWARLRSSGDSKNNLAANQKIANSGKGDASGKGGLNLDGSPLKYAAESFSTGADMEGGSAGTMKQSANAKADKSAVQQAKTVPPPQMAGQEGVFQQGFVQDANPFPGEKVLPPQLESMRESIIQQLEGRLTYFRETGSNPAEMRLTLHPPELGEVTVRVFSKQGQLSASILAESSLVREILESSIAELRQRMNFVSIQFEQQDGANAGNHSAGSDRSGAGNFGRNGNPGESQGEGFSTAESEQDPIDAAVTRPNSGIDYWA